jgi:Flp pilus assembly protein CpaB
MDLARPPAGGQIDHDTCTSMGRRRTPGGAAPTRSLSRRWSAKNAAMANHLRWPIDEDEVEVPFERGVVPLVRPAALKPAGAEGRQPEIHVPVDPQTDEDPHRLPEVRPVVLEGHQLGVVMGHVGRQDGRRVPAPGLQNAPGPDTVEVRRELDGQHLADGPLRVRHLGMGQDSPHADRSRPRPSSSHGLDLRVVIGLALLLAGVVGTVGVVERAGQRTPVLVMARDVPAGQLIDAQDVRVVEIGLASGVAALGVQERERVVGRVAGVPLWAGQVLGPTAVAEGPPLAAGLALMSVAVAPEHAAAGTLRAGDQVAVVASSPPEQSTTARAAVLLSPVLVVSVVAPDPDTAGDGKLLVSLAIPQDQAATLAQATHGTVDLVLLAQAERR